MRNAALLLGLLALAVLLALLALEPWGEGDPAGEGRTRRLATPPPVSARTPVAVAEEPEAIGGSSIARTPLSLPLEDLEGSWGRWNRFVVRDSDDRAIRAARVCLLGDGEVFAITDREGIVIPPGRNLAEGAFVLAPGFTPKHIGPTLLAKMKRGGVSLVRDTDLEVEVGRGMPYRPEAGWQVRRTVLRSLTESVRREFDEIYGEPLTTDHTGRVTIAGALFTHRSGRFTARLELDHPRFGTWTVQPRPRSDYEPIGRPPHLRIKIDRARPAPCVKIENGNRVPLSGVPVRVRHGAVERLRSTDPLGRLALRATRVFYEGKEAAASAELDVEVDLGSNRFWHDRIELAREPAVLLPVLTVDHRPVTGSIVPPPPPGYSVATAPETFPREDPNWIEPSDWELLFWQPVPPDGRFRIESGWQGPETIVYLRHDATGLAVDYDFADRVHGCFFQLEESCRVELACPTPGPLPDIPLTLRNLNTGRPVDWLGLGNDLEPISLASLPRVQELPRGEYELRVAAPGMVSASIPLEAEDRDLRVELPPVQRMRGIVRGELSGPLPGIEIQFTDRGGSALCEATTNRDGAFEVAVLGEGPPKYTIVTPGAPERLWEWDVADRFEEQGVVHIELVRREAILRFRWRTPVLPRPHEFCTVCLFDPREQRLLPITEFRRDARGSVTIPVPPGTVHLLTGNFYDLESDLGWEDCFSRDAVAIVDVQRGQTRPVTVPAPHVALLELTIEYPAGARGRLQLSSSTQGPNDPEAPVHFKGSRSRSEHVAHIVLEPGRNELMLTGTIEGNLDGGWRTREILWEAAEEFPENEVTRLTARIGLD